MKITGIERNESGSAAMNVSFAPLDVDRVISAVKILSDGKAPWLSLGDIAKLAMWNVYDVAFVLRYFEKVGVVEGDADRSFFRTVQTPLIQD